MELASAVRELLVQRDEPSIHVIEFRTEILETLRTCRIGRRQLLRINRASRITGSCKAPTVRLVPRKILRQFGAAAGNRDGNAHGQPILRWKNAQVPDNRAEVQDAVLHVLEHTRRRECADDDLEGGTISHAELGVTACTGFAQAAGRFVGRHQETAYVLSTDSELPGEDTRLSAEKRDLLLDREASRGEREAT